MVFTAVTGILGSAWLFSALFAAQIAGPAAIVSWLIGGIVAMALALVYAELGGMLPVAGALARLPYFAFGPLGGFVAGWLCWIAYAATAPIEVLAMLDYASNYFPELTRNVHGDRVLTAEGFAAAAVLMLVFTAINLFGVKWLARTNITIGIWKLIVPVAAPIILIAVGFRAENFTEFGGFAPYGVSGILGAISSGGIVFAFFGFRSAMDLAGEAKNPAVGVPTALIGAIVVCLGIYLLLQVALPGVIPPEHLANGWKGITETAPGGPFAAFATILGMSWLAWMLYSDAIISPGGTAIAYLASTSRVNYAMSMNGQIPKIFERLNRFNVPVWSLLSNFVVGMLIFLPFPGWSDMVGFISSTAVLSFAFGPIAFAVMRRQLADIDRPFRVPFGTTVAAVTFIFVGFIVYWTGWETNWKIFVVMVLGLTVFAIARASRRDHKDELFLTETSWIWIYYSGLAVISYLGNFGGGLEVIPQGVDAILIVALSLFVFQLSLRRALTAAQVEELINLTH